jgi:MATE family multidrug resistance protein
VYYSGLKMVFVAMAVCFLVAIPGAGFIMDLFRGADSAFDPEVYRHTGFVLFCIMFFREIAEAVICISMGALRGVGDTRYVMLVQSGVDVFVWIPLVFAVAKWHPTVFALWMTMPVALGLMALLFLVRWRRGGWRGVDLVS